MTDEEGIRRTIARYCHLCDDGRFDEFETLFTHDAMFGVMGRTYSGRAAIRAFMEAAQGPDARGKHLASNTVITVDGHAARAETDYVFVSREREITSVGRYYDVLVREPDGEWRFASRQIAFLGDDPPSTDSSTP